MLISLHLSKLMNSLKKIIGRAQEVLVSVLLIIFNRFCPINLKEINLLVQIVFLEIKVLKTILQIVNNYLISKVLYVTIVFYHPLLSVGKMVLHNNIRLKDHQTR